MFGTFEDEVRRRKKTGATGAVVAPGIMDAITFAQTRLGVVPDEKQRCVLESTAKRGILNCSRQWGKSTVTAAKAVHRAYTRPGSLVLVAGPTERQSAEFLRKASAMVRRLHIKPQWDGDHASSLKFPNGSMKRFARASNSC